jgi:hypothetical protein
VNLYIPDHMLGPSDRHERFEIVRCLDCDDESNPYTLSGGVPEWISEHHGDSPMCEDNFYLWTVTGSPLGKES